MEQILKVFKNMDFERLALGLLVLVVCLVVSRVMIRLFNRLLSRSKYIEPSMHSVLKTILRIVLYFLSVMVAAGTMGIPVTSFLALFSVVGLAVSLAVQGVLSNLAGGIIILVSKPFTLGDYIETDAVSGTVHEIGFLHTRMIAPDGKMIFVPNSLLYNSKLINYTSSGTRRIDVLLNLGYDSAPEDVRRAALHAILSVKGILAEPEPQTLLENYGESCVQYTVRVWCAAQDYLPVRYALNEALHTAFREAQLNFSYPHLNIHMKG